jgi:hypothetical protein
MLLYNVAQAGRETLFGSLQNVVAADNDGRTPLHHAAQVSLGDALWALVENGIDVRVVDKDRRISLYDAARPGSEVAIWALVVGVMTVIKADTRHDAVQAGPIAAIQELGS